MSFFNILNHNEEDLEKDDYDITSDQPEEPKAKPAAKKPNLKPEDPDYWDQEESEWEHLRPRSRTAVWLWTCGAFLLIALMIAFYLRYLSPYRENAIQYGYVESIDTRGTIFKTIEGVMLPYRELMDTTRVYKRDFLFTAQDKNVAAKIYELMQDNKPVQITYKEYSGILPWRGETKIIVTGVKEADPKKILPPEYQPQL